MGKEQHVHILIAPGAFKHSLSAVEAAAAIAHGLERSGLKATLDQLPIADGGNGTLDAWLATGGERISVDVYDPLMRPITSDYGLLDDGHTAIIEMALASGIELLAADEHDPLHATTYGTGQLLGHALERGARRFIIGMGGSATVDGGSGALRALGVRLLDVAGQEIPHGGGHLKHIASIDAAALDARWQSCEIIIAADVDNPALGSRGAAAIFGPQKGASQRDVAVLEENLAYFFDCIAQQHSVDVRERPGSGAAGALAGGLFAFLGGRIESGIDLLLAHNRFEERLATATLVVTGEGRMDEQTIYGKGPVGVARLAQQHGIPAIALVGGLDADDALLHEAGLYAVLPIASGPMSLEQALQRAAELLERAALRLGYLLQLC